MNYTVIGNPVIVASRLEGLNKYYGTQILISPGTRHDIGELFALRLVDHVLPMGKTHPMPMYEVLGESDTPKSPWQEFFDTGLEAYRQRRFASARELFRRGAEEDPVCRVFAERCDHFLAEPPPADWNGVWHATGK
jgi:adenylate cyclase